MTNSSRITAARSLGLTRAQLRYLVAIRDATACGLPATHRELAAVLGVVPAGVHQMLTRLHRDGLVAREAGRVRTIRLTPAGLEAAGREPESVPVGPGFTQDRNRGRRYAAATEADE